MSIHLIDDALQRKWTWCGILISKWRKQPLWVEDDRDYVTCKTCLRAEEAARSKKR